MVKKERCSRVCLDEITMYIFSTRCSTCTFSQCHSGGSSEGSPDQFVHVAPTERNVPFAVRLGLMER